jgi:hypothetical protein
LRGVGVQTDGTRPPAVAAQETADSLLVKASEAYRKKEYGRSAQLYAEAVRLGAREVNDFYNAACSFALAGRKDEAFGYLARAATRCSKWPSPS